LIVDYLFRNAFTTIQDVTCGHKANEQTVIWAFRYGVKRVCMMGGIVDEQQQSQNLRIIKRIELGE
jgi:hypothetical protein